MSKGPKFFLTDSQYQEFVECKKNNDFLFLRDIAINPSFVVKMIRQPAEGLFELYGCDTCSKKGFIPNKEQTGAIDCPDCNRTGLNFTQEPKKIEDDL